MTTVVTGAAGFIGSTLCRRLLAEGHVVRGIDCLTKTYDVAQKMANIASLIDHSAFDLFYADLSSSDLESLIEGADVVYHLAGQASVGASWGAPFADYTRNNVNATNRLLDTCTRMQVKKVVYASSSSVYGDAEMRPTPESVLPRPVSPYGATKLAAEHLVYLYQRNFGLPTASLRLFTVYGPKQRPDMAFHRLVRAAVDGTRFVVNGDGTQTRDFTFVDDVVDGFIRAGRSEWTGTVNIGGGSSVSLREAIAVVEALAGPIDVVYGPTASGDAVHTSADIGLAGAVFGYAPRTSLQAGLQTMVDWTREQASSTAVPAASAAPA